MTKAKDLTEKNRYRGPLIAGFYVCRDCGCVVQDRTAHDRWHADAVARTYSGNYNVDIDRNEVRWLAEVPPSGSYNIDEVDEPEDDFDPEDIRAAHGGA